MEPQNLFLYLGMNGRIKMAQENFIRRYLMKVGKMGHNGFQIGQTSTENPHALHISFSIEKSTSETANTAKVQIWNLCIPAGWFLCRSKMVFRVYAVGS